MNTGDVEQASAVTAPTSWLKTPLGVLAGALFGAVIGIVLSKSLWLGERVQQMDLQNTGSSAMLIKIETKRWTGDGEVVIEPGKTGSFIYGEGDKLSIFSGSKATSNAYGVTLERKPILAEANADERGKIAFSYKCE